MLLLKALAPTFKACKKITSNNDKKSLFDYLTLMSVKAT